LLILLPFGDFARFACGDFARFALGDFERFLFGDCFRFALLGVRERFGDFDFFGEFERGLRERERGDFERARRPFGLGERAFLLFFFGVWNRVFFGDFDLPGEAIFGLSRFAIMLFSVRSMLEA